MGKKEKKLWRGLTQVDWRQKKTPLWFSCRSLSMDSEPPLRPPLPPGVAGDAAPTTTAGTASMRCSSAPASARKVGAESSTSSLPRKPKVAAAGRLADPVSFSQQQQQQQPPQQVVFCRICLDSDTEGLIAPCQCRGERVATEVRMRLLAHLFSLFSFSSLRFGLSHSTPLSRSLFFTRHETRARHIGDIDQTKKTRNKTQERSSTSTSRVSESGSRSRASATAMVSASFFSFIGTAHSACRRSFRSFPWTRGRLREVLYCLGLTE